MTNNTTLARPYAKAVFEAAKAANQLQPWSLALHKLSLIVNDKQIKSILKNPNYSQEKSCELLLGLLHAADNSSANEGGDTQATNRAMSSGSANGSQDTSPATNNGSANGSGAALDRENHQIKNFIYLLAEKKRLSILPNISELFEEDCATASNYLSLTVTSAFSMDDQQHNSITKKLSKQFNSTLKIDFHVDADLIGGLLVRSAKWVLDDTIKGKLSRLKSALL